MREHFQKNLRFIDRVVAVTLHRAPDFHNLLRHRVFGVHKFFGNTGPEFVREFRVTHKVLQEFFAHVGHPRHGRDAPRRFSVAASSEKPRFFLKAETGRAVKRGDGRTRRKRRLRKPEGPRQFVRGHPRVHRKFPDQLPP